MYQHPPTSDITADVVVLGTGPGGLSAVGAAVEAGADVVAIEAHDRIGGNGSLSTGWVAFVDSGLQRAQGIQDSVELFMKDSENLLRKTSQLYGVQWDRELTKFYAEKSGEMYDVLTEMGVKFSRLIKRPLQTSVDRLAAVDDTNMFPEAFDKKYFSGPKVRTFLNCAGQRLVVDNEGGVTGVIVRPASEDHKPFTVYARKGVILTTGGYGANLLLRRQYQRDPSDIRIYSGLSTCRGDGQLMGQAIGGELINMTMIPPIVAVPSHLTEEAIAVNRAGKRFHDEAGPYYDRVYALDKQSARVGYYIFDEETYRMKRKYVDQMAGPMTTAPDITSLATKLGLPAAAVEQSVNTWNSFLSSSKATDPETGRVQFHPSRRQISIGPFHSKMMVVGVSLTCGGFATTKAMQVVDIWGSPIPGLFAAGDCAGGLTPTAEMGGTHLGGGFVLGWEAGRAAATGLDMAEPHKPGCFGHFIEKDEAVKLNMPIIGTVDAAQQAQKD
jgi:fumarate reductase flavoprotein subunit